MQHTIAPDGQFSLNLCTDAGEVETLQKYKRFCLYTRKFFDALRAPLDGAAVVVIQGYFRHFLLLSCYVPHL